MEDEGRFAFDVDQADSEKPEAAWSIDMKEIGGDTMLLEPPSREETLPSVSAAETSSLMFIGVENLWTGIMNTERLRYCSRMRVKTCWNRSFRVEAVYGDFDKSEFQKDSESGVCDKQEIDWVPEKS